MQALVAELHALTERIIAAEAGSTPHAIKGARRAIDEVTRRLAQAAADLDPVIRPASIFDPTDPVTAGRVVALTLVAQQRYPLSRIPLFYGAGVYALYYKGREGAFPAYGPLSGTDHPIYVGKADPSDASSKNAVGQGQMLARRLREHAARIGKAATTLNLDDFECRFLIVQTGFQTSAEDYLIRFFKPIWNSSTKICFGMSKHGDSASIRSNDRSPWFTMHPGVDWADHPLIKDQKPKPRIEQDIAAHFGAYPPYRDIHQIFDLFMRDLQQIAVPLATEPIPVNADEGQDVVEPGGQASLLSGAP